jgi:hypothetical protein
MLVLGFAPTAFAIQGDPNVAEQERQKLAEAGQGITDPSNVGRESDKDLETLALTKPLLEYAGELEKKYAQGIASDNQPYRNLKLTIEYNRKKVADFEKAIKDWASLESIKADAEHARKMVAMSIEYQAPAYYREESDIAIKRRSIATRIQVLERLAPDSADLKSARELANSLAKEVAAAQTKLLKGILEQNQLPEDNYSQSDREALLKLVTDTWTTAAPQQAVLKTGLIGDSWTRTKKWEIQNRTLYLVERSEIQGYVVVEHDDQTVACRRIRIRRDHLENDKLSASTINDPKVEPSPMELVLKSKLK